MTTTTLRPNATVATGAGTTAVGGTGTLHGVTSDNSDSSYALIATHTGGAAATKLDLGTVSLPAGSIMKTVRLSTRGRADTTGTAPRTYKLGLRVFNVLKTAFTTPENTTTLQTFTGPTIGLYLSQTDVDNAQIWLTAVNGGCDIRVAEVYLDVTYALKPTTTVSLPTGTITTTTMPTVSWTHTPGTDGDVQNRYQIKIFNSATYTGGGFSADTSTPTWQSAGQVLSSVDSATVDTPLPNSTTYRAYVRTAQQINGILQWADWAFSGFDIAVTPPTITSVGVTPSNSTGSIAVTVNRNTGGPAWDHVTVERTDDGGTSWKFVRGASYAAASGNTFSVTDYEAPNGDTVQYRAQAFSGSSGSIMSSPIVTSSTTSWSTARAWLKSLTPAQNVQVQLQTTPAVQARDTTTISLVVLSDTAAQATAVETLLGPARSVGVFHVLGGGTLAVTDAGSGPLLLSPPPSWNMNDTWMVVTGWAKANVDTSYAANLWRAYNVDAVIVDRPGDV